jgi:biopolymer transport protein ExbB
VLEKAKMIDIFLKGGPIMWPLLLTSIITVSVAIERILFVIIEKTRRDRTVVKEILAAVERSDLDTANRLGIGTKDAVARILYEGLQHGRESLVNVVLNAANRELKRFSRGLSILDTAITLAPLLGLLGTVTGLIRSFSLLGNQELGAPAAITGGIAEALIATAFGLSIAIMALIPFNYLNAILEENRHDIQDATTQLELMLGTKQREAQD